MDGRNIVSFNRFFSAQEIVKSNEENGVSHNPTYDVGPSYGSQYVQYGDRNHGNIGGPRSDFHQFQTSSDNAAMCGGPSSQYEQYGRNTRDIDSSANNHAYQPSSNNSAVFGGFNNQYGHIVGHQIQDFGSSMNQFRPSNNIAVGGLSNQYRQVSSSNPILPRPSNHYVPHDGLNNRNINGSVNMKAFPSNNNGAVFGGPSNQYGHHGGNDNYYGGYGQFHSPTSSNNSGVGGINSQYWQYDGRNNCNIGGSGDRQGFQSSAVFGGFGIGNASYPSEACRFTSPNDEGTRFNGQYGPYDNRGPPKTMMHPTGNQTSHGGEPSHNSHANMNAAGDKFYDTSSANERAKLKTKIVEAFKEKASKPFFENSARFIEDEWLNVWYVLLNGLRSYQCQMTCPVCYKKLTPQNRSEPGNLPRWDLTIVKGHLERLHSTKLRRAIAENEDQSKMKEEEDGRKTENADEKEVKKTNEEEGIKTIEKPKMIAAEPLDLLSSPESLRQSSSLSSSSDDDAGPPSSSSSSDHTTVPTSKKRLAYTRKQSSKRGKLVLNNESDINPRVAEVVVSNMRNLMKHSLKHILRTFSAHEKILQEVYDKLLSKKHYKPKDLPDLLAHDIMSDTQLGAMAQLAELKLAKQEHHNSTDVIFDAILPEWALAEFCKEFKLTRTEAVQVIRTQNEVLINQS